MSVLKINASDAREIVWGGHEDWETIETNIDGTSRWEIQKSGAFRYKPTDKVYLAYWSVGATEQQDVMPYEFEDEAEFFEAEQVERTIKVWVEK